MNTNQRKLLVGLLIAALAVNILLALFMLPQYLFGSHNPPPSTPDSAASTNGPSSPSDQPPTRATPLVADAADHLGATQEALTNASAALHKATTNNKGGFVEKGFADIDLALTHIQAAATYAREHPDSVNLPATRAPSTPDFNPPAAARGGNPRMTETLVALKSAFNELAKAPGGELGGFRDKTNADIAQAVSDVVAGIEATRNGGPGRAAARPAANAPTPTATITTPMAKQDPQKRFANLHFPDAPANASDLISPTAKRFLASRPIPGVDPNSIIIDPGLRSYYLDYQLIVSGAGFETLSSSNLRFGLEASGTSIGYADLRVTGGDAKLSSVSSGTFTDIASALEALSAMDIIKNGSYEPRLVEAHPPVNFVAIWLVSDKTAPDLIYPIRCDPSVATPKTLINLDDLYKTLRPYLRDKLKSINAAPPGAGA